MNRQHFLRLACFGVALSIHFWLAPPSARADLLTFSTGGPDILDTNGSLTYNQSTGEFQSVTSSLTLTADALASLPGSPSFVFFDPGSSMTIDLQVNSSGGFVSNGTGVTLTGSIDFDGDGNSDVNGTLLQGHIINFGAQTAGPPTWVSNGLFVIDSGLLTQTINLSGGGTLDPLYSVGELAGFTIYAESVTGGTLGDFTADFSSDIVKDNVDPVVPEPPMVILGLVGAGLLGIRGWRSRRRRLVEQAIQFSHNN
jgi:hypothetical protein